MTGAAVPFPSMRKRSGSVRGAAFGALLVCALAGVMLLQQGIEARRTAVRVEGLGFLPPGEYLKPVLLGYQHVAADVLWLRLVQVLGERKVSAQNYEWLSHALDVITTLDPQYDYAYQVGAIVLTEYAHRVDWSNRLLEKGLDANPTVWHIPFYLGYNHFFYSPDYPRAADYMARASRLPGHPPYLPRLAARLYAQAGNPETALEFLDAMWRQTKDEQVKEVLEVRMKEMIIERDIRLLEEAVRRFTQRERRPPATLAELVERGILRALPPEPFGGVYRLTPKTGEITSSTHPERLRVYRN